MTPENHGSSRGSQKIAFFSSSATLSAGVPEHKITVSFLLLLIPLGTQGLVIPTTPSGRHPTF